jgi:L-gulono-1,4-lactone dehydrogenase
VTAARRQRLKFKQRKRWHNHTKNAWVEPLRRYEPKDLDELTEIVREAREARCTIRAVGSGHSWSDVALTPGYLIETHNLSRPLEIDCLRSDWDGPALARVQAGMRIRELNNVLWGRQQALKQMGGYDGQTVAGVISTSTHGSGLGFGPLSDNAVSIDLVAADATVHRVEREGGPTDPASFAEAHPGWELHQGDDWFNAVSVSMGCMGVIYAVTLEVRESFWLTETRELKPWSQVREDLLDIEALERIEHYEVLVNPYEVDGERRSLITTRVQTASPAKPRARDRLRRNWLLEWVCGLWLTRTVLPFVGNLRPSAGPSTINSILKWMADKEYTNRSYKVFNIGTANYLPAYSSEIGVPVTGDNHVRAIEEVFAVAQRHRELGGIYETSPIALRFVRRSPACMSMMHAADTMMIELIQMVRTEGGFELLGAYEDALYKYGGRPHWGQVNTLTGSHRLLGSMYPELDAWIRIRDALDPAGMFDSPFAKRVGISQRRFPAV